MDNISYISNKALGFLESQARDENENRYCIMISFPCLKIDNGHGIKELCKAVHEEELPW